MTVRRGESLLKYWCIYQHNDAFRVQRFLLSQKENIMTCKCAVTRNVVEVKVISETSIRWPSFWYRNYQTTKATKFLLQFAKWFYIIQSSTYEKYILFFLTVYISSSFPYSSNSIHIFIIIESSIWKAKLYNFIDLWFDGYCKREWKLLNLRVTEQSGWPFHFEKLSMTAAVEKQLIGFLTCCTLRE